MRPEKAILGLWTLACVTIVLHGERRDETPSEECNNNGYLTEDGFCQCFHGYTGRACKKIEPYARVCMRRDDVKVCSGRGECLENSCLCFKRRANSAQKYSGRYCECDDYSCPYHNGQLCGGLNNGFCNCGKCDCKPTFIGDSCECSLSMKNCTSMMDGSICNNRGKCECNRCKCEEGFRGPTCQENINPIGVCQEFKSCVQCRIHSTGLDRSICFENPKCSNQRIMSVDNIPDNEKLCEYVDETDSCMFYFSYAYDELSRLTIKAQTIKVCPKNNAVKNSQSDDPSLQSTGGSETTENSGHRAYSSVIAFFLLPFLCYLSL